AVAALAYRRQRPQSLHSLSSGRATPALPTPTATGSYDPGPSAPTTRSGDVDDDGGDVVVAAPGVGKGDEDLGELLGRVGLGELQDLLVLDQVGEPIRAEHEEVALLHLLLDHVHGDAGLEAHRARDDVAQMRVPRLLWGEDPGPHL